MKNCPKHGKAIYLNCQECDWHICEDTRFYLLIVGSRTYTNYTDFYTHTMKLISRVKEKGIVVVSGGAYGTDKMAERFAKENGFEFKEFKADWGVGNSGGYERNKKMHQYIASFKNRGVIAFWDGKSKGTKHSFNLAKQFENPIRIIYV